MTGWPDPRYRVDGLEEIDSPAVLVFPDLIERNIERALALTATDGGHCLQPHIKTVKSPEAARLALERGITRFKCSTVSEGELLGGVGAAEVLLSYQLSAPKAARWRALRRKFPDTTFASLVDNAGSARLAAEVFADDPLPVYVDVNPGMDRTGVKPADVPALLEVLETLPGLYLRGFHVYDGHIRGGVEERGREAADLLDVANTLRSAAEERFGRPLELVMAGSPNFPHYVGGRDVWVSPGTFFLWDAGYGDAFAEWEFAPAALVLTRVLSVIDGQTVCFDLGSKAVSPDKPQPRAVFPGLEDYTVVGQWEEHLVLRVPDTSGMRVGDAHFAVPSHVCTTVNLYEELLPVRDGRVGTPWRVTARDRRITI